MPSGAWSSRPLGPCPGLCLTSPLYFYRIEFIIIDFPSVLCICIYCENLIYVIFLCVFDLAAIIYNSVTVFVQGGENV